MGSESFPRQIAGLITEDPDEVKEGPPESDANKESPKAKKKHTWPYEFKYEFEELEDTGILGNLMYGGQMNVGASFTEGEAEVRYLANGDSGHPGSPSYWEWEIIDVSDVFAYDENGEETTVDLTDELKKKLIDALHKHESDDTMQERLDDDRGDPEDDRADVEYDRWKDEGGRLGQY